MANVNRLKETRNKLLADHRVDWNTVFRAYNAEFDKTEKILQLPGDYRQREELKRVDEIAHDSAKRVNDPTVLKKLLAPEGTGTEISKRLADVLFASDEVGGFAGIASTRNAVVAKSQLTDFAIALALYHRDHSTYPKKLAELAPRYIATVPKDPFLNTRLYLPVARGRVHAL